MSNEMSVYSPRDLAQSQAVAETLARSGLVAEVLRGKPEAVWAILALGHELGMGPMAALSGIHVIAGKPGPSPQTMLALCLRSPVCEYFTFLPDDSDEKAAFWVAKRRGSQPVRIGFTIEEARECGYLSRDGWRKQPKVMLRWRCMAALARIVFPDITQGLYTTDELDDVEDRPSRIDHAPPVPRAERAAATVSRRVQAMRHGTSSPPVAPPAESIEEAEVVDGHAEARAVLTGLGLHESQFDAWALANGRQGLAVMAAAKAGSVAEWLRKTEGAAVRKHAEAITRPVEPDAPNPGALQAALEAEGISADLADAWAQHKGIKPATAAGARALWLSIMHPDSAGGMEFGRFSAEYAEALQRDADAAAERDRVADEEKTPW